MSLENGLNALQQKRYAEAVQWLEDYCHYCQHSRDHHSQEYSQAQAALVKAYNGNGENKKAIALCRKLENHPNSQVSNWAKKCLATLTSKSTKTTLTKTTAKAMSKSRHKAGRVAQTGIRLAMKGIAGNLALASGVTISLLFGMVLVLSLSLLLILNSNNPVTGLIISVAITLIFNKSGRQEGSIHPHPCIGMGMDRPLAVGHAMGTRVFSNGLTM
ncbi:hypothetical protein BJP36_35300 [Moorena producens JHB]|uniref:Uncharacterized protein n=2 Tax=Moorena TaxID=1155738 RepID=A0A1D9GAC1_MOOP1|nr:hypothetical protein [Moorena producens]AOY84415.1 hypothetical protein BJP36_35300 [Moorena producens JHB]